MSNILFNKLRDNEYLFKGIEIVPQLFADGTEWLGYVKSPRPSNGLVFITQEASFIYSENGRELFCAKKGDIVFAPKGCNYKVVIEREDIKPMIVSYTVNFKVFDDLAKEVSIGEPLGIISRDELMNFLPHITNLNNCARDVKPSQLLMISHFTALLDNVIQTLDINANAYYPIRRGVEALRREWLENRPIGRYAKLCSMSETGFRSYFKKWAGMSPVHYRNRMRIAAAQSVLTDSAHNKISVAAVANMSGFEDPFYFSRVFKSIYGVSPQKFIRNIDR